MNFISTRQNSEPIPFSEAMVRGLAPDGGLYVPEVIPQLGTSFWNSLKDITLAETALEMARPYIDDIEPKQLKAIIDDAFDFEIPLVPQQGSKYILELYHGPTLAFKDIGARFMARIFAAFRKEADQDIVILAATSGDTGSAVARGFQGMAGFKVCLLYPSGKVSKIQEQQLTTAGQNVTALEVKGNFDDCQQMVKQAFTDTELNKLLRLSSANSINIARLLPQSFYYTHALGQLKGNVAPVFVVPSGNFGNLTAGLLAYKMGMPVERLVAATNINDVIPEYLQTGTFKPRPSRQTISNAMDIGNPSNFERIQHLFNDDWKSITERMSGDSFTDAQTREAIQKVYKETGYIMDPHTAVGYLAAESYANKTNAPCIILSTAHPSKFGSTIEPLIDKKVQLPDRLAECMRLEKQSIKLDPEYGSLKMFLQERYG